MLDLNKTSLIHTTSGLADGGFTLHGQLDYFSNLTSIVTRVHMHRLDGACILSYNLNTFRHSFEDYTGLVEVVRSEAKQGPVEVCKN